MRPTAVPFPLRVFAVLWLAAAALCLGTGVHAAAPADDAVISIGGRVDHPLRLDAAALDAMHTTTVRASAHGSHGTWSGPSLIDVLEKAGVPTGERLRGRNMRLYVRIRAADGYQVIFTLAELDPALGHRQVVLADRRDGHPLDEHEGPFRLIVPGDARPARWIRQVQRIDVLLAASADSAE